MKRDKLPVYDAEYFEPPRGKITGIDWINVLIWGSLAAAVIGAVIGLARLL